MSPSLPAVVAVSLALGVRHAFEPDHLAAVSTLATRSGRALQAAWLGLAWGLGHTASVAVVALLLIAGGLTLPARLRPAADVAVGVLLVALGASVLWRYAHGRWHIHRHAHEGAPHFHLHSHVHGGSHAHAHARWDARRSLGFGLLHGLAGSGAIVVLLVATVPTAGLKLAYVAAFGIGTVIGMLAVSLTLVGVVRYASRRGERWATVLHLGSALASVAVGVLLVGRTVTAL
ncbi:MAG: urease accessory protein [Gemmatimonadetes bacterium]|nr:MAG: urease accessory protein [Gemmatimonadota bacterium]